MFEASPPTFPPRIKDFIKRKEPQIKFLKLFIAFLLTIKINVLRVIQFTDGLAQNCPLDGFG